jgi:hypothetical protein
MKKSERLKLISSRIGNRHYRKLNTYSDSFNELFRFFYQSYRKGILTFCGSDVNVKYNRDGKDAKLCFRLYEDGMFKTDNGYNIESKHNNLLRSVIIGKKSWGLWKEQWSDGISECSFTFDEIVYEFEKHGIKIPNCLLKDFRNLINEKRH